MIPTPVEELDEADAILDQPTGQEAIVGKGRIISLVKAARIGCRFGFRNMTRLGPVHHFGNGHLHAEGQFVLGNPR